MSYLDEALKDLSECPEEAREFGLAEPTAIAMSNAEKVLREMYRLWPIFHDVHMGPDDGEVALQVSGGKGYLLVILCGPQGEILCIPVEDGKSKRKKYNIESMDDLFAYLPQMLAVLKLNLVKSNSS